MIRFKRLLKSFSYAGHGLFKVLKEEQNFKIEVAAAIIVLAAAWRLKIGSLATALLVLVIGLVLIMEIINSAVEAISDVLKPKLDNYVKRIKDIVAAGVMVAALTAVVVGLLIFGQYLFR